MEKSPATDEFSHQLFALSGVAGCEKPPTNRLNLYWNLKYIDVRSFILTGAPFAYKTANSALAGLATCDDGGQRITDDPDLIVVDFNLRDDGLEVGLSRLGIAGIELISHELGESGEPIRGNHCTRLSLGRDPIKGSLCEIVLRLECVDPFFQLSVKIDDAILDRAIEPVEFFVGGSEFGK